MTKRSHKSSQDYFRATLTTLVSSSTDSIRFDSSTNKRLTYDLPFVVCHLLFSLLMVTMQGAVRQNKTSPSSLLDCPLNACWMLMLKSKVLSDILVCLIFFLVLSCCCCCFIFFLLFYKLVNIAPFFHRLKLFLDWFIFKLIITYKAEHY